MTPVVGGMSRERLERALSSIPDEPRGMEGEVFRKVRARGFGERVKRLREELGYE